MREFVVNVVDTDVLKLMLPVVDTLALAVVDCD